MNWNVTLFKSINALVGRNKWLDAFGRAGAEWAIIAMAGWYGASVLLDRLPNYRAALVPFLVFGVAWVAGWLLDIAIGLAVKEPRPHITYPESKLLFSPLMSWKSFPSDHAMSAWLIFFLAVLFNLPGSEALLFLALWVSWGRVFSGAHYPFDIIGGMVMAGFMTTVSYYILVLFY